MVSWTNLRPVACESSVGFRSCPVELPNTAALNCGSRPRLALAVRGLSSLMPLMPIKPKRPLSYGSTRITSAKIMQAPSAAIQRKGASQRPQAWLSELEVDKFIGLSVSKLDQDRDRHEPEHRGDALLGPLGQARDNLLARRQQECAERRYDNRHEAEGTLKVGQFGKAAINVHGGLHRASAEDHAGKKYEDGRKCPAEQRWQPRAIAAPHRYDHQRAAMQSAPQHEGPAGAVP